MSAVSHEERAPQAPPAPQVDRDARRRRLVTNVERSALVGAWALLIIGFGLFGPSVFLSWTNFATLLGTQAVIVVLTLGMLIPMTSGDYDLSSAFTLTLSGMIVAVLNVQHGWPVLAAIAVAIVAGMLVGAVNGAFILLVGIDSLIVTLGTGTFVGGLVFWISDSNTISGLSPNLVDAVIGSRLLGIPLAFWYALALGAVVWYVFEFTPLGRRLLIVGRGRNVARLSGISTVRTRWIALIACGGVSAFAGVLYAGNAGGADPTSGTAYLLPAFAAAFLGATAIQPGRFNPWGSIVAVYFLATGINGLQLMGASSFVQQLFYGGSLVIAVALSQLTRGRQAVDATGASS